MRGISVNAAHVAFFGKNRKQQRAVGPISSKVIH